MHSTVRYRTDKSGRIRLNSDVTYGSHDTCPGRVKRTRSNMWIQEITRELSISFLQGLHLGRIACAEGSQPYVTPFCFAYHGNFLYSFGTFGKKIAWMRANPLVCVEADTIISRAEWHSVVVFGRYEELPNTAAFHDSRVIAHDVLAETANWWE